MSSSRDCALGRQIGLQLWNLRTVRNWTLACVALRAHLSIEDVTQAELVCDDDEALAAICAALGVPVGQVIAQANGHVLLANTHWQDWDEPVEEDEEPFHF